MKPFTSWRTHGTTDFGAWRPGRAVRSNRQLAEGDVIFVDSAQFDALNLAVVTGRSQHMPGTLYARFVDPHDTRRVRRGARPEGFAIHEFETTTPLPDGRPHFRRARRAADRELTSTACARAAAAV